MATTDLGTADAVTATETAESAAVEQETIDTAEEVSVIADTTAEVYQAVVIQFPKATEEDVVAVDRIITDELDLEYISANRIIDPNQTIR